MFSKSTLSRFFAKVSPEPNSGCWLWTGAAINTGYGVINVRPKLWLAHRLSYRAFVGPIGGLLVLHRCDVRCCVNPERLFTGSQADNMADMLGKGRQGYGKPLCRRGHPFTPENTIVFVQNGYTTRRCISCRDAWRARYAARERA